MNNQSIGGSFCIVTSITIIAALTGLLSCATLRVQTSVTPASHKPAQVIPGTSAATAEGILRPPCSVTFIDADDSYSVTSGDLLRLPQFERDAESIKNESIKLRREGDTFGVGHRMILDELGVQQIMLGADPILKIGNPYTRTDSVASGLTLFSGELPCDLVDQRIDDLVMPFEKALERRKLKMQEWSSGGNAYFYYYLSNYLEGLTSMYEATGNLRYLDLAVGYVMEIIASGKDNDGDGYLDYFVKGPSIEGWNVALYEWRGFRPFARTMRIIGVDQKLRDRYRPQYDDLRAFVTIQVIEKWSKKSSQAKGLAYFEDDGLIHRVSHMGDILVDAAYLSNGSTSLSALNRVGGRVRQQLRSSSENETALEWNILFKDKGAIIRNYQSLLGVSDTSHASGVVSFIVADTVSTRSVFDLEYARRFAVTLMHVIWSGNMEKPAFADFVDKGIWSKEPGSLGARNLSDGWVKLGMIDPEVQRLMMVVRQKRVQSDQEIQLIGNLARNFAFALWY